MYKILIFIASLGLITTIFNISNYANARDADGAFPHVDSKFEFPQHRWAKVRQTIQIHVPRNSQALENLRIAVPNNINFQISKIEITSGDRPILAAISRKGQELQVNFDRPISPDTQFRIDFNSVERNMQPQLAVYYLYGKTVDRIDGFLGEAYFPQ
ncbi:DUF2808 domain-containing protein [Chamaesiphon sp. GL140_3_metabinner_50]|uniref:DUF2808 domain-containing protein n=1 Tax=Chamaesiphon sp. GL140_3_metabinner_50 TaxID=2970812 RepID=UPI0025EF129F|nr:DUF2808 domain-containing protein [Chamaesiphon sp. GL140_3_metabinner_50]